MFFKKKIKYTKEMQEQYELWKTESEDLVVMKKLYLEIIENAKKLGFKGVYNIYENDGEMIVEVFKDEETMKLASEGKIEVISCGHCIGLINELEDILNKKH